MCIVAKRLMGSGCRLGWWVGRAGYGCIRFWWWSSKGKGQFRGEFAASHCNQWGLCCVVVWKCVERSSYVWRGELGGPRHSCVRWKSTCFNGKGLFLAWFSAFCEISAPLISVATWRTDRFSTRVWKVDNISLGGIYHRILCKSGFLMM